MGPYTDLHTKYPLPKKYVIKYFPCLPDQQVDVHECKLAKTALYKMGEGLRTEKLMLNGLHEYTLIFNMLNVHCQLKIN